MLHTGHVRCHQALSHSENEEDAKTHCVTKARFFGKLKIACQRKQKIKTFN